jgi:hypothetical protein
MKTMETLVEQLFAQKLISPVEVAAQKFFRLEAERDLVQAKGEWRLPSRNRHSERQEYRTKKTRSPQ